MARSTFIVKNPNGTDFLLTDLGQIIPALSEVELQDFFSLECLLVSPDLTAAFSGGDLQRLDGPGGSPVDAGHEQNEIVGGDLFGSFPNPEVSGIRETSGPTNLSIGIVSNGSYLQRDGTSLIGISTAEYDIGVTGTSNTVDWGVNGIHQRATLGANTTFSFNAPKAPGEVRLLLIQDNTGSRTVTWPGSVVWPGGVAPTLTVTASAKDLMLFYWNGTNYFGRSYLNYS